MDAILTQQEIGTLLLHAAWALALVIAAIVVGRVVRAWILRLGARNRLAVNVAALLGNLAQVGILLLAVALTLPLFGIDWTALLTVVGAASLAISFAFQDLLRNIIAGVYLLIELPFKIGDVIAVGSDGKVAGSVQAIALRTTSLRTADGLQVIVPNSVLMSDIVTNRSAINLRRHVVGVSMAPDAASLSAMNSRITEALRKVHGVAGTPPPTTRVDTITAQIVKLHVEFWSSPASGDQVLNAVVLALRETMPTADVTVES